MEFHIQYSSPFKTEYVDWPNGCWSLYQITGDEISQRIVREGGKVVERHSWCGFVGCFHSMDDVSAAIKEHMSNKEKQHGRA